MLHSDDYQEIKEKDTSDQQIHEQCSDTEKNSAKKSIAYKRMSRSLACLLIGIICLAFIYFIIHLSSSPSEITFIKHGTLESYTNQPLGTVLDTFFYQPTWEITADNTVRFTGRAYWGDEEATFSLLFTVNPESHTFDVQRYEINNKIQTYDDFIVLLDTLYDR
ncbi:MAG: hypothetical protein Q3980_02810 [Turicibacter sp.]|nr:hypothetical protein [Turicibacter sp.]